MDGASSPAPAQPPAPGLPSRAHEGRGRALPSHAIAGQPAIASAAPFGIGRPGPSATSALLRMVWSQRGNLGHARAVLGSVDQGTALGVRGLSVPGARGPCLTAGRVARVADHTDPVAHPSRLAELRHLRSAPVGDLRRRGRLGHPMCMRPGDRGMVRLTWDDAEALAAEALAADGADQAWIAGDVTNEAAYTLAAAADAVGAPLDSITGPGHRAALAALDDAIGSRGGTCRLTDIPATQLLLLWRADLPDHAPEALAILQAARARGARIVVIDTVRDPAQEATWLGGPVASLFGTTLVDDTVLVPAGSEGLVVRAVLARLVRWGAVDEPTCARQFSDWPARRQELSTWRGDLALRRAGVSAGRIDWLAKLVAAAPTMLSLVGEAMWADAGGDALAALCHLHLATGPLRRPGCGVLPVWSTAASQGCHDLGVTATDPSAGLLAQLERAEAGALSTLVVAGADLTNLPDPRRVRAALQQIPHRIHHVTHVDPALLAPPHPDGWVLVLPATSVHDEAGGTTTTTLDRRLMYAAELPTRRAVGSSRSLHELLPSLVAAARPDTADDLSWATPAVIRRAIADAEPRYAHAPKLGPDHAEQPLGPARLEADATPRPLAVVDDGDLPHGGDDQLMVVRRHGVRVGGGLRLPATGRGLRRDEVGVSAADARSHDLRDGGGISVSSSAGSWMGVVRIVDIADGHLWLPWPEAAGAVEWPAATGRPATVKVQAR